MKKIAVGCLTILLCTATSLHAQLNNGTDVRSTSLRTEQPAGVPQNVSLDAMGTVCASPCFSTGSYNWLPYTSGIVNAYGITYCATNGGNLGSSSSPPSWASGCQDWVNILGTDAGKSGSAPLSVDSISDTCTFLLNYGNSLSQFQSWQSSYDTLQLFIDRCALRTRSWSAFGSLGSDVQNLLPTAYNFPEDSTIYAQYRTWLYSVLYLNTTDPEYFCQCVEQIFGTFGYVRVDTANEQSFIADNFGIAVDRWLLLNTNCDSSQEWANWQYARSQQRQLWQSDSIEGTHYPYDTTIPPLDSIYPGLDTLLARHALYASVSETPQPGILSNATANPNPVTEGTVISFSISKEAYVKIELFDVLGKQASSYGYESLFEPGNKSVSFSLAGLPSGTYYAHIITAYGEVQTVKLVKE